MLTFAPVIIKQDAYELDNLNEHGAELPAFDVTLDEQQVVARRSPLRGSEGRAEGCRHY